MYSGGTAQSAHALNGRTKKLPSLPALHCTRTGALKLPWYHLGSQHPHGHCLRTAAENLLLTAGRFNGRTRRRLSAPAPRPRSSETIFSSLFPALFHPPGFLVRINARTYSSLHSHFCDIAFILLNSAGFVNPLQRSFLVGNWFCIHVPAYKSIDNHTYVWYYSNRRSAVRNRSAPSGFSHKNDRHVLGDGGGHFLLSWISLKIVHEI